MSTPKNIKKHSRLSGRTNGKSGKNMMNRLRFMKNILNMRRKIAENVAINQCKTCTNKSLLKGPAKMNQLTVFREKSQKNSLLFYAIRPFCLQSIFQLFINGGTFKGNGKKSTNIKIVISFFYFWTRLHSKSPLRICALDTMCVWNPMFHFKLEHAHQGNDSPDL